MNSDKILSQEEINAMLPGASPAVQPTDAAVEPAPPVVARTPQPDPNAQATVDGMNERLGDIVARLSQMERSIAESNAAMDQIQQDFSLISSQIQLFGSRMEGVLSNLKATLGYRAQRTYVCNSCKTKGEVAAKVKCTHCNHENWWGWWPGK